VHYLLERVVKTSPQAYLDVSCIVHSLAALRLPLDPLTVATAARSPAFLEESRIMESAYTLILQGCWSCVENASGVFVHLACQSSWNRGVEKVFRRFHNYGGD
jgi:hypothetical protein